MHCDWTNSGSNFLYHSLDAIKFESILRLSRLNRQALSKRSMCGLIYSDIYFFISTWLCLLLGFIERQYSTNNNHISTMLHLAEKFLCFRSFFKRTIFYQFNVQSLCRPTSKNTDALNTPAHHTTAVSGVSCNVAQTESRSWIDQDWQTQQMIPFSFQSPWIYYIVEDYP